MAITKKMAERIQSGLKRFVPILSAQRDRDVSEADTVTLVKDLMSEVFGYDKYAELTSEHAIRGTFCDLAVQFDGKLQLLIEIKVLVPPPGRHVNQSIDYASNRASSGLSNEGSNGCSSTSSTDQGDRPAQPGRDRPRRDEDLELYLLTRLDSRRTRSASTAIAKMRRTASCSRRFS
jgi:hypothetical protein